MKIYAENTNSFKQNYSDNFRAIDNCSVGKTARYRRRSVRGFSSRPGSQQGVALVVAIILLIVITLMGLAAVRGTIMQQKMTSNFYDRQLAFQAAEAGLRQAEAAVQASARFLVRFSTARRLLQL